MKAYDTCQMLRAHPKGTNYNKVETAGTMPASFTVRRFLKENAMLNCQVLILHAAISLSTDHYASQDTIRSLSWIECVGLRMRNRQRNFIRM